MNARWVTQNPPEPNRGENNRAENRGVECGMHEGGMLARGGVKRVGEGKYKAYKYGFACSSLDSSPLKASYTEWRCGEKPAAHHAFFFMPTQITCI